jgi:hypothetical protein
MSVRKRRWRTQEGEIKEAWVVDYTDQGGMRHLKTFEHKNEADAYARQVGVIVRMPAQLLPSSAAKKLARVLAQQIVDGDDDEVNRLAALQIVHLLTPARIKRRRSATVIALPSDEKAS